MRKVAVLAVLVGVTLGVGAKMNMGLAGAPGGWGGRTVQSPAASEIVRSSKNSAELEQAASALARSRDPRDLTLLGQLLRDGGFLARLDDPSGLRTFHLSKVMETLAAHPSRKTAELCLTLADDPVFLAEDDRKGLLLVALAAVRPMSDRTAAVFQRTNEEGYFAFNAPLLAANGTPIALNLFESMMLDRKVPIARRMDGVHASIVPHRINLRILRVADLILLHTSERALTIGVIESVFDFRPQWFGTESRLSGPPPWQNARADSLRFALTLAETAAARPGLEPSLRRAVVHARETIVQTLGPRPK